MINFEGIDDVLPEDVGHHILTFLDVLTFLVQKRAVCHSWQMLFTNIFRQKAVTPKAFQTRDELREAVKKYTKYNHINVEEFAQT
eukprot:scaffold22021_cov51-Attheya_sp.AAC.1